MTDSDTDELPGTVRKLVHAAQDRHWLTWATHARVGDVQTVAVRFTRRERGRTRRCYGVWTCGTTATGKPSMKWRGGATSNGKHLPTVAALADYLGA